MLSPIRSCGLGAAFHAGRRAALVEALRAIEPQGTVVVRGLPPTRDYARFTQDKTFWYLTGIESPNASIVIDVATGTTTLFLPRASKMAETWEGELWDASDVWVRELTGIDDVRPTKDLLPALKKATAETKLAWISKLPWISLSGCFDRAGPYDATIARDPLDGRASREDALETALKKHCEVPVRDMQSQLAAMRLIKTPEEIVALRRASDVGAQAMIEAIRSSRAGLGEWELEALMTFVHRRAGAAGAAYQGIVGCGPNALVLHYSEVSRSMRAGEMVLLDYAPEVDHYVSDITRSWPVDGVFTERMAEIHDVVLEAQLAGIAEVRPGKTMADVDAAARRVLAKHGMSKLMPHGVCHYVGMEVHDVGDQSAPFVPGVVFTVEPGVYEPSTGIGVRIEDVVLVTEDGCEVLSAGVPKDRAAMTRLVAEEGILERVDRPVLVPVARPVVEARRDAHEH